MVASSFPGFGAAGGNQANAVGSHCVDNGEKPTVDHAERNMSILIVSLAIIQPPNAKWIVQRFSRHFK